MVLFTALLQFSNQAIILRLKLLASYSGRSRGLTYSLRLRALTDFESIFAPNVFEAQ